MMGYQMIKRYLVFAGLNYYPYGGWSDFVDSFDNVTEAHVCALNQKLDWWQVVDTQTGMGFDSDDRSPNNKEVIRWK